MVRAKLEMPSEMTCWTGKHILEGVPRTSRHMDVIDVGYWAWRLGNRGKEAGKQVPRWFCNASQSVHRHPWGATIGMVGQKSLWYSYELDRVLDTEECVS